jgi:cobalt-zinc-cadmium efflux system outer membrane protein
VQAEAAAAGADADLQSARADLADALARLSVLAGSAETYTSIGPSLLAKAESAQDPTDLPPESAPTFVIAQARREAAVRRTQAERGRAVPNVDVTFGARTLERQPETALVGGVSVQLPLFNRNQGGVAVAKAELMAADARARSARIEVTSNWAAARAQLTANRARLSSSTQAEAAARDGYQLMQIAYQAGKASLLELLLARRALNDSATRTLEAQIAALRAQATLARLAGRMPFGE